jgi:hypothetical protein
MKYKTVFEKASLAIVFLFLLFLGVNDLAEARGGGRGGGGGFSRGGGGGGFSRGGGSSWGGSSGFSRMGTAGSGSFSGSAPQGERMSGTARPGNIAASGSSRPGSGIEKPSQPISGVGDRPGSIERPTHPISGVGGRPNRPDRPDRPGDPERPGDPGHGGDDDHHHHWDDDWYGGWYGPGYGYGEYAPVETVVVQGETATEPSYELGTILSEESVRALSCSVNRVEVNGQVFYQCGTNWFRMAYAEGQVTYVVVKPPRV